MYSKYINQFLIILLFFLCISGCKKFIEVEAPPTSVNSENVYSGDNTAIGVLTAIIAKMNPGLTGEGSISSLTLFSELSADHLEYFTKENMTYMAYYQNDLKATFTDRNPALFWRHSYTQIYIANAAIEGISNSTSLTPLVKERLLAEAKFMRAFYFFYLVNLYGDVPLTLTTNYKANATLGRTPVAEVYQQIIKDLKEAQTLLSDDYLNNTLLTSTDERIRPNKGAATALLARVYLYSGTENYANAEIEATKVIDDPKYSLTAPSEAFLKNGTETIWSLQPTQNTVNTWAGFRFLLPETGPNGWTPFYLSDRLLNLFNDTDLRLQQWTNKVTVDNTTFYYPYKYKVAPGSSTVTEYEIVFRLAEQYLIRAEARAHLGKLTGTNSAASDLNAILNRAGLGLTTATTKQALLDAIILERQRELFIEWGHRWLDLKRTGTIDAVMSVVAPLKGGSWEPYKALYPILQEEIAKNPGMTGQQNPGYTD